MKRLAFILLILFGGLAMSGLLDGGAQAASFDCSKARKPVEQMICADVLLSGLDDQLNESFKAAGWFDFPELRAAQIEWAAKRDSCPNPTCVAALYRTRINELRTIAAKAPAPVDKSFPQEARPAPAPSLSEAQSNRAIAPASPGPIAVSPAGAHPDVVPILRGATPAQACAALDAWAAQLLDEFPKPGESAANHLGDLVRLQPAMVAPLLRDPNFVPYFGIAYDRISDDEANSIVSASAGQCMRSGMRAGFAYPAIVSAFHTGRPNRRQGEGPQTKSFRDVRQRLASSSEWLARMNGSLAGIPATAEGLRTIDALELQAEPHLANLWPSERAGYAKAIEARRTTIVDQAVTAHITSPTNPSLVDLAALESFVSGLDEKSAAAIRQRVNSALERRLAAGNPVGSPSDAELQPFRAYPVVRLVRPAVGVDPSSPPDRMIVWEGQYKCGPSSVAADLVVFGPLRNAKEAYFLIGKDKSDRNILQYDAKYDEVLDGLKLTFRKIVVQNTGVQSPRQLDLAFENQQSTVRGRMDASCEEFVLRHKDYPKSLVAALTRFQKESAWVPTVTLAAASNPDQFCLALAAWAKQVKTSVPGGDYMRLLGSEIFKASIFHPSFALQFAGRDFTAINSQDRSYLDAMFAMKACSLNPLFFEDQAAFTMVFYNSLNNPGLKEASQKLRDIETRANRISQAADKFSPDSDGLTRISGYLAPLEAELAGAVAQTRDTILTSAWRRQTEIAGAILQNGVEQSGQARSLDRLEALDTAAGVVRSHGALTPDSGPVLARAEAAIAKDLEALLAAEHRFVDDTPQTLEGLVQLKAWQVATAARFGKLAAHAPYTAAMAATERQAASILNAVIQELPRSVSQAPDTRAIRAISTSIEDLQKETKESQATAPLWAAYKNGLDQWFSAAVQNAPQARTGGAATPDTSQAGGANPLGNLANLPSTGSRTASVFVSPDLKEANLITSVYQKNFRSIYPKKERTQDYLVEMLKVIGPSCPGSIPADFLRSILKQQISPDILSDPAKAGQDVLMGILKDAARMSRNPGGWLNDKITDSEVAGRAEADARTILAGLIGNAGEAGKPQSTPCDDPALKIFLENAQEFFADPTAGVSTVELAMGDLCKRAMPEHEADYRKAKYCDCAGPVFDQTLNRIEKSFVRLNPRPNFWDAMQLIPDLRTKIGKCAL